MSTTNSKTLTIKNYKKFYIQQTVVSGGSTTYYTRDTKAQWGMVAKSNPYPLLPDPKECYTNNWKDQNGEDEYNSTMHYKPLEISVSFYVKAVQTLSNNAQTELRTWMDSFFDFVKNGEVEIYDEYTALGFRNVRYAGYEEESFKQDGDWARAIFTVKFKVNDPTTRMKMQNGKIVTA